MSVKEKKEKEEKDGERPFLAAGLLRRVVATEV